ncbi:hypothetical protein SLS63_003521 [Diaporthe eres]|uniref:F-box domain-containing protein n=1 Tax=Diaporthe eres TaxID=83184 RepID=A0ABR1PGB7_DIAER
MEADNIPHKPTMDQTGRKIVDQDGAGQQEVKTLSNAIQVQPNGVTAMSESTACLSSRNHFCFLDLPAEIRNMVYQYAGTYSVSPDAIRIALPDLLVDTVEKARPNLRQPPITRVNR